MRDPKFTAVRSRMVPLAALGLVTALGGCVGYSSYPSGDYGYAYLTTPPILSNRPKNVSEERLLL